MKARPAAVRGPHLKRDPHLARAELAPILHDEQLVVRVGVHDLKDGDARADVRVAREVEVMGQRPRRG